MVTGVDPVTVAEHLDRARRIQVGAERDPHDPVGLVEVRHCQRADLEPSLNRVDLPVGGGLLAHTDVSLPLHRRLSRLAERLLPFIS